jgi:Ran GTPase-activating protein (RanGAP) involved in mRNA processing and transport
MAGMYGSNTAAYTSIAEYKCGEPAPPPINPVSIPTELGNRMVVDLGYPVLNLQSKNLEDPQASLHQRSTLHGTQVVKSIFEKLGLQNLESTYEELNLNDNHIFDEGAEALKTGLNGNTKLKKLYLARTMMKAKGFKDIGTLIGNCASLEEVLLSGNMAGATALQGEFCDGLTKNKTLKSLYLGQCRLGVAGAEPLLSGPMKSHPALQHLSLTYNRLDGGIMPTLNSMLAANMALRYLDLSGNSIGPKAAEQMVEGLKKNKGRLQKLSLAQNEIKHAGCKALAHYFVKNPDGMKMEFLDLRHNLVTYHSFVELSKEIDRPIDKKKRR